MSTIALTLEDGTTQGLDAMVADVKRSIEEARADRRKLEPVWQSNIAFAAGQFWLRWDRDQRRLVFPQDLLGKELYTAPVLDEYRMTALGELGSDDDRPELLLRRDDEASEMYQAQLNRAMAWGWENEWDGDTALDEARRLCIDITTSAIRCYFDPNAGPQLPAPVPFRNGKPLAGTQAYDAVSTAVENGQPPLEFRQAREGKIRWVPGSGFNLLVPPGIPHENDFPWEAWIRPVPLSAVKAHYGSVAADLKEDQDIGSMLGMTATGGQTASVYGDQLTTGSMTGRVRGHVWLINYFERPTPRWPNGRTITFASNKMVPVKFDDSLPYVDPAGEPCSGIVYFHWWRVSGRFWSRSLVEAMKDVQRGINKRKTQINEIIDRSMPFTLVEKDSLVMSRRGTPNEFVQLRKDERPPVPVQGYGPGPWMQADVEAMREDLTHAAGLKGPSLGENPANVTTYSQLSLILENDQTKRQPIIREQNRSIKKLVELSVYDMRTYWGDRKQLLLTGDDNQVQAEIFDATKIPPFYIVRVGKGIKPRSQAAELQKIEDIARFSIESGQPLPPSWLKDSLEAGQALDLPQQQADDQTMKAHVENHRLLQGERVQVDYFDPPATHIPIHRSAQIQAILAGRQDLAQNIEAHVQEHLQAAQQAAAQVQAAAGPPATAAVDAGATEGATGRYPGQPPYGARLNQPI